MPNFGISRQDLTKPKTIALGGIAATSIIGGGVLGALKGHPLAGIGIGAAIAATALGAALLGNASSSTRDGFCDFSGDPDCDYPYDPGGYDPNVGGYPGSQGPYIPHSPGNGPGDSSGPYYPHTPGNGPGDS